MDKKSSAALRLDRLKEPQEIIAAYKHNERHRKKYGNKNIDSTRSVDNYHIRECTMSYSEFFENTIESLNIRPRKGMILFVNGIVSPSPEWINAKTLEEQRDFFSRSLDFLCQIFRSEYIASAVVHMDETNPHMHLCLVPITRDNRLCFSSIIPLYVNEKRGFEHLQDDYFAYMGNFYPDLVRGTPKTISKREHVSMPVFKAAPDFFNRHEEFMNAVLTIDQPRFRLSQNKEDLLSLYTDISRASANLILDQQQRLDIYEQRIIPRLRKDSKTLSEEIGNLSSENILLKRSLSVLQNRCVLSDARKDDYKKRLDCLSLAVQSLAPEDSSRITAHAGELLGNREKNRTEQLLSSAGTNEELSDKALILPCRHQSSAMDR